MRRTLVTTLLVAAPWALGAQETPPPSVVPLDVTVPIVDTLNRVVAVVGNSALTFSDLLSAINERRAQGMELPGDSAGQVALERQVLSDLVDEEILVQQAKERNIDVPEADVTAAIDRQIKQVRSQFRNDLEYRTELKRSGFGTPEEYRRYVSDQIRRRMLQEKAFDALRKNAKPGSVTEEEVNAAFERARPELQKRPATISFRQIVVTPKPSDQENARARAKAESLLAELRHGASFEELAKRESMDPTSDTVGGDLGWHRRGEFVPEFEAMMFAVPPGQLSPVFKTVFGYHILRVDRVEPGRVKVRHILITPTVDSNDVHRALLRADSVAQQWRNGANFDSLLAKYHDPGEEKGVLQPDVLDSLPQAYRTALANLQPKQISAPFPLTSQHGTVKYAVVQVLTRTGPGEYSLSEIRETIRAQLQGERQARDILDGLRKRTYVSLRY